MKRAAPPTADGPFFEKYLVGEAALSGSTAQALYSLSQRFDRLMPWRKMPGDLPILLDVIEGRSPACACVMGSAGEIFGLKISDNPASIAFLRELLSGEPFDTNAFLREREVLSLEFTFRGGMTQADRDLLNAMGHPRKTALNNPQLRCGRPGFKDWYLTEDEGARLRVYLEAIVWLLEDEDGKTADELFDRYEKSKAWPCVLMGEGGYELAFTEEPTIAREMAKGLMLPSRELLELFKPFAGRRKGAIELGWKVIPLYVGPKNERPALMVCAMAVDAVGQFAHAPQLVSATDPIGPALAAALLAAVTELNGFPSAVRHRGNLHEVRALTEALGLRLVEVPEVARFDYAMEELMAYMNR